MFAMSLDMSDSDIEPFIPGQDENKLDPKAGGCSTGTDLDETPSPPSISPAIGNERQRVLLQASTGHKKVEQR